MFGQVPTYSRPKSPYALPASSQLNIEALAGLFGNTTTSYKYLSFHALLDEVSAPARGLPQVSLERRELGCPYTGAPLTANDLSLDHVLPWSFVAHDELWNLVPVTPSCNSSKGNRIPQRSFVRPIAELHAGALLDERRHDRESFDRGVTPSYLAGLHLDAGLLEAPDGDFSAGVVSAYEATLPVLFTLAKAEGFVGDWAP